jgi:hypothetical protein
MLMVPCLDRYSNESMGAEFNKPEYLSMYAPETNEENPFAHLVPPVVLGDGTNI